MKPQIWRPRGKLMRWVLRLTGLAVALWALYGLIKQHPIGGY